MAVIVRDRSFYANLIALAAPIMLQSLISFGINFTDNLMIGSLGESSIAGVYLGSQIQGFLTMMVGGIEGGMMVLTSQYWGKREIQPIKDIIAIGVRLSFLFGIIFCGLSLFATEGMLKLLTPDMAVIEEGVKYLQTIAVSFLCFSISQILISAMRSVETVKIGMWISLMSFVMNVILNYVFIFGKLGLSPMGVRGAALATLVCRILEMCVMLVYVFAIDKKLALRFSNFIGWNVVLLKDFLRYGLPVLGGQIVWSINLLVQSAIIGRMSAAAIAAVSISNMLFNLVYVGMGGLGAAVSVITGKTVGAGEFELMKTYAKTIQLLFLGLGLVLSLLIFVVKDFFLSLYALEPDTIVLARQFMMVLTFTVIGTCYQAGSLSGLVKAGGDTGFVFKNDTIFVFLVVLPSAAIALFVFKAPAWVVFLCLKSDQILKCFVAVVKINRFKWMKNLTRDFSDKKLQTTLEET